MAKGSNLLGVVAALEALFDRSTADRVVSVLPSELSQALRTGQVVVGGWYPLGWYKELHRAAQRTTGRDAQLARELAHFFVTEQLGGVYKALMKMLSPHWLFHFPTLIFSRYFSVGTLTIPESRPGFVRAAWSGCREFDRNLWNATFGGCQAALERAGAKGVRTETLSGGRDGDETAEACAFWR